MPKHTKLSDLLEKDKDRFISVLEASPTPEKAAAFLESETDRLLIRYNEADITENERNTAALLLRAVRMAMPMVDSVGETKVWEAVDGEGLSSHRQKSRSIIFLAAGILSFAVIALLTFLPSGGEGASMASWLKLLAAVAEGSCLLLAGYHFKGKGADDMKRRRRKTENIVDPSRLFRLYRSIMMVVDNNIESKAEADRWEQTSSGGESSMLTDAETELYGDLLEALYSKDGEYALDKLRSLKHYLHTRGVELRDYSEDTAADFDIMPSKYTGTLRPAIISGGTVLRRGMAAEEVL